MDLVSVLSNAHIIEYNDKTLWIEEAAVLPFDMYVIFYCFLL